MPDTTDTRRAPTRRSLRPSDAEAVFDLMVAAELRETGAVLIELDDIRGDWSRPSFDLASQTVGFFDDDDLVAYGEVHRSRAEAYVHPEHYGRGLGTALVEWTVAKARELGCPRVGQSVPVTNTAAVALLRRHGYDVLYTSWVLELPADAVVGTSPLPAGHRLRAFDRASDARDVYQTIEDAFNEWPNREPTSFDDWSARSLDRSDFEPWQIVVAVEDRAGRDVVVGAARLSTVDGDGWVDQIAVRRDVRGRGVGGALLDATFEAARARGARRLRLNTDSRTGALGLYLHVGMHVAETYEHYSLSLA